MPYEPGDYSASDTITLGEHHRKMGAVHKSLDGATKRAAHVADLELKLAAAEASVANAPDAAKAAKRLERAEKERDEAVTGLAALQAETATKDAMVGAGIIDADDMDLVRHKFGLSEEGDFERYLAKGAREDRHLAVLFDAATPAPTEEAPTRSQPPNANGGVRPAPAPTGGRDIHWLSQQPNDWKNDPANRATINEINGAPPGFGVRSG